MSTITKKSSSGERRSARSERADEVRAIFGLHRRRTEQLERNRHDRAAWAATAILDRLAPGGAALITGPSGGGKSTILRALTDRAWDRDLRIIRVRSARPRSERPPVSLLGASVDEAMAILAGAGLADARLATTPARLLSDGESARFALARAMDGALRSPGLIVADEFCAALDGPTAMGVARSFTRWLQRTNLRAVVATARDEMIDWLSPELICWQGLDERALLAWGETHARSESCTDANAASCADTLAQPRADRDRARVA